MEWADEKVVADAIAEWTPAQVECRSNRHSWKDASVSHRPGLYTLRQRCTRRCGAWRQADMNDNGYMVSKWHVVYPKDGNYLMPKGSGRVGRDGMALINLSRVLGGRVTVIEVQDDS